MRNFFVEIHEGPGRFTGYRVVARPEAGGGYWAEVPALPGCVTQGETLEEVKANAQEAIASYLETLREQDPYDTAVRVEPDPEPSHVVEER